MIDNNNNGQPAYVIHWKLATATKTGEVKGGYYAQNSVPHRKKSTNRNYDWYSS